MRKAIDLQATIARIVEERPPDEVHAVLCYTLARLGRGSGFDRKQFVGSVLSDVHSAWRHLEKAKGARL